MYAGILPLKDPQRAKQRLTDRFSNDQREAIAQALYDDALALAAATAETLHWLVVSDAPEILKLAAEKGLTGIADDGADLNAALTLGLRHAVDEDLAGAVVVPGDLPLMTPEEIVDLADTAEHSQVVVVPSGRDGGTNGLALTPPDLFPPAFGTGSFQRHLAAAEDAGARCTVMALENMSYDLDTPEDVDAILTAAGERDAGATVRLLRELTGR